MQQPQKRLWLKALVGCDRESYRKRGNLIRAVFDFFFFFFRTQDNERFNGSRELRREERLCK